MSKPKTKKIATIKNPANRALDLLSRASTAATATRESLVRSGSSVNRNVILGAKGQTSRRLLIPIEDFVFQYAFGLRGFLSGTLLDVLAPENVGKTTLTHTLFGWGMNHTCFPKYIDSENKPLMRDRIERCLHRNPEWAARYYDAVSWDSAFEIREAVRKMLDWFRLVRDPSQPATFIDWRHPLICAWDTFSKLMAPSEALGMAGYAQTDQQKAEEKKEAAKKKGVSKKKKEEAKEIGTGSNFEHSKLAQGFTRQLAAILSYYNAFLIMDRHQNEKVDMNAMGGGSFGGADSGALHNKTSIGGRAFSQSASYQLIMAHKGYDTAAAFGVQTKVRRFVRCNVLKNTFAPNCREFEYALSLVPRGDREGYREPALTSNHALPDLLMRHKALTIQSKNKNSYSCKELKLVDATTDEFAAAFYANKELVCEAGRSMGIYGYEDNSPFILPESLTPEEAEALEPTGPAPSSTLVEAVVSGDTVAVADAVVDAVTDMPEEEQAPEEEHPE